MTLNNQQLRPLLVGLGVSMGVERYVGQHPTDAAHEFAGKLLEVIDAVEDRVVERITEFEVTASDPCPDPRFEYVQVLRDLEVGQFRLSRLGSTYRIVAIEKSGYCICQQSTATKRIWCDVVSGWTLV